jgi:hypothetical protein
MSHGLALAFNLVRYRQGNQHEALDRIKSVTDQITKWKIPRRGIAERLQIGTMRLDQ